MVAFETRPLQRRRWYSDESCLSKARADGIRSRQLKEGWRSMHPVAIELPESVPSEEAKLGLALSFYARGRISQGQAAAIAGVSRVMLAELLRDRGLPFTNIEPEDLDEEMSTWDSLRSRTAPA